MLSNQVAVITGAGRGIGAAAAKLLAAQGARVIVNDLDAAPADAVVADEIVLGIPDHLRMMSPLLIPLGRPVTPVEAAGGILLLASPFAAYIAGHVLEVTGGAGI